MSRFGSSSALPDIAPDTLVREAWQYGVGPAVWAGGDSFSGKTFARLESVTGPLFLRRLPFGTSGRWLQAVHDAAAFVERRGFTLFPRFLATENGETAVRHSGFWFDLTPWAPGEVVQAADMTADQLANLSEAVATLHLVGANAPGPPVRFDWLTTQQSRQLHLAWDPVPRGKSAWQHVENLVAFFTSLELPVAAPDEVRAVVDAASAALRWLRQHGSIDLLASEPSTLAHGDLWSDHVRFAGSDVTAVLDLDTLAVRPPAGDLAALCADFGLWDSGRCAVVLNGYRRRRPVSAGVVAELPALGALRALGVLRQLISVWLEASDQPGRDASLVGPISHWCTQLHTVAEIDPRAFEALAT